MEIIHGFMEITNVGKTVLKCSDRPCTNTVKPDETYFVDVREKGETYCLFCGASERYYRRKAAERRAMV